MVIFSRGLKQMEVMYFTAVSMVLVFVCWFFRKGLQHTELLATIPRVGKKADQKQRLMCQIGHKLGTKPLQA